MELFFVSLNDVTGDLFYLRKDEASHLRDVLKYQEEDEIFAFDGEGSLYRGMVGKIGKENVRVKILEVSKEEKPLRRVILVQAIPNKKSMDYIVEKATELGVDKIIPVITSRTISLPPRDKQTKLIGCWRKVALEASRQSKRLFLPEIKGIKNFKEVISSIPSESSLLIPHLGRENKELKKINWSNLKKNIFVFIGPEDDFSEEEVSAAEKMGAIPVSLGKNVLKVETAAYYALSVLKYEFTRY
ncbi:MAG: RsmE family RNA methyltransferase [Candidatus Omnitrophica bacterium]|nr:RsmE family RNA methyltransferase [Candidatus Omnitrophota bacterium]